MDLKKTVLRLIEPWHIFKLRGLHQTPGGIIAPAMISAAENSRGATLFAGDRIGAVATHIVECADLVVFPPNQEDGEAGDIK